MFRIKDVFTTVNLLGGIVAVCLCIDGNPFAAGIAVMLGFMVGDTLDGWVARKLGSANSFGSHYDTIADHTAHCLAPGAIVYTVYSQAQLLPWLWGNKVVAIALAATIMIAASIRHARNAVRPIEFQGAWAGLPRSVLGFAAVSYVNASFVSLVPGGLWFGVVLIPVLAGTALMLVPFANHRLPRGHFLFGRVPISLFIVTTVGTFVVYSPFVFDVLFGWMLFYFLASRGGFTLEERKEFQRAVLAAKGELAV